MSRFIDGCRKNNNMYKVPPLPPTLKASYKYNIFVSVQLPPTKYDGCFRTQEFKPMTRQLRV
jgi:hypothetical protein